MFVVPEEPEGADGKSNHENREQRALAPSASSVERTGLQYAYVA